MKQVVVLPSFERSRSKLASSEKHLLVEALQKFNAHLLGRSVPHGFGFKRIGRWHLEFRVDIRLRAIVKIEGSTYYLVLVGSHDEIRRYLKEHS